MERQEIYTQLKEQIPYPQRHECTPRVMQVTDYLLDMLLELNATSSTLERPPVVQSVVSRS